MRYIPIYILSICLLLSSCTSYYYSVMNTEDPYTQKNEKGEFLIEGDSLDVMYSFFGQNAPITISVINKMSSPIYVDWRESGIVIDNVASSFKKNFKVRTEDKGTGAIDFGRFQTDPKGLGHIKPHSKMEQQILELSNFNFHKIKSENFVYKHTDVKKSGREQNYKSIEYIEDDSPLFLKTYLTIYLDETRGYEPILFDTDFYQSKLIQGGKAKPNDMEGYRLKRGDFFYVQKQKGSAWGKIGNTSLKILGGVALVGIEVLLLNGNSD